MVHLRDPAVSGQECNHWSQACPPPRANEGFFRVQSSIYLRAILLLISKRENERGTLPIFDFGCALRLVLRRAKCITPHASSGSDWRPHSWACKHHGQGKATRQSGHDVRLPKVHLISPGNNKTATWSCSESFPILRKTRVFRARSVLPRDEKPHYYFAAQFQRFAEFC